MVETFMNIEFTREELRNIIFPENPVICRSCRKPRINKRLNVNDFSQEHQNRICTVGKYHGRNNQNIAQNNAQNNVVNNQQNIALNNVQNIVPENFQNEIPNAEDVHIEPGIVPNSHQEVDENMHDNQHNDQNYVTREEFIEFKESVNSQFQLINSRLQSVNSQYKSVNEQLSQIKQSIEKLGGRNFNKERQREKKEKKEKKT